MFAHRWSSQFDPADRRRGEEYFLEGRVVDLELEDEVVHGLVEGSRRQPYKVTVDLPGLAEGGRFQGSCDCPRFADGYPCKHLWATLFALDHEIETSLWDEASSGLSPEDVEGDALPPGFGGTGLLKPWRRRLELVEARADSLLAPPELEPPGEGQAFFVLSFEGLRQSAGLRLDLYQRQPRKTGELGKIKPLLLTEEEIGSFASAEDRELLTLLLATPIPRDEVDPGLNPYNRGYGGYGHSPIRRQILIPHPFLPLLLPRLAASGKLLFAPPGDRGLDVEGAWALGWDDGPPWQEDVRLEGSKEDGYRLKGRLVRGEEERSLDGVIAALPSGFILFRDHWARIETGRAQPWLWELARGGDIEVPAEDLDGFISHLWSLPGAEAVELPEELQFEVTTLEPVRRLSVEPSRYGSWRGTLDARVVFDYEGRIAQPGIGPAGWADVEGGRRIQRSFDKEQEAWESLKQRGFRVPYDYYGDGVPWLEIPEEKFLPLVGPLLEEGWEVTGAKGAFRRPSVFRLQVKSGIDWFTLEGEADFGDTSVALPELLRGLRKGERFVKLGDGSTGVLPEEWLRRLQELADLSSGGLRYSTAQALLLDALLSAREGMEVEKADRFRDLKESLAGLAEAPPAAEPRGFHGELRPYQRAGLGWLNALGEVGVGGCLADDMGLGKTIQVLALLQGRRLSRSQREPRPSLAVVPKSLVHNWIDEAARFTPRLELFEWTGTDRHDRWAERAKGSKPVDLIVTTYGTLRRDAETFSELGLDYAVLDEAQAIKNPKSQTAKACRLLPARHRLALTGTPVENSLEDLWSLFEFLNPGMLGRSKVFLRILKARSLAEEEAELLRRALRPFILRRTKEEVLPDLPAKTEQVLHCDLDATERRLYDQLRRHYHQLLREKVKSVGLKRSKIHVLEALLRLRQAACHPGLVNDAHAGRKGSKIQALLDHLQDAAGAGHKSLVFSQFTSFLALVRRQLETAGIPYAYLDGRTRDRKAKVASFQEDPELPVFLISLKAGGSGLNLTAADYVFLLDPWWNPAVESQAIDRTHRIGQTRPVVAYRLISRETVEEKVVQLQTEKRELAEAILAQDASVLSRLSPEDLEFLLS